VLSFKGQREQHVDVLVIGGGVCGVVAATLAAKQGLKVCLVKNSHGATGHSSGAVDVISPNIGAESVFEMLSSRGTHWLDGLEKFGRQNIGHPYARVHSARELLVAALAHYTSLLPSIDYVLKDDGTNHLATTDFGTVKECLLVPSRMCWDIRDAKADTHIGVVGIEGFSAFNPHSVASTLSQLLAKGGLSLRVSSFLVPLKDNPPVTTAAQVMHAFERTDTAFGFAQALAQIAAQQRDFSVIFLPALLGVYNHLACFRTIQQHVSIPVRELLSSQIPSAPGLRLSAALLIALRDFGVEVIEGVAKLGREEQDLVNSIHVSPLPGSTTLHEPMTLLPKAVILSTGRYFSGGMTTEGAIQESVFSLPIWADNLCIDDTSTHMFLGTMADDAHPLFRAGIHYDDHWRPLDRYGAVRATNLFAAGSLLGGYDPSISGTALGVAILTGYAAGMHASRYVQGRSV
jgi:glycerol-3-phosphate dehydrogenase subunit B